MKQKDVKYLIIGALILIIFIISQGLQEKEVERIIFIKGVSFVSPRHQIFPSHLEPVKAIGANYVAVIPYAMSNPEKASLIFDHQKQWYGEKVKGTVEIINAARMQGLQIMLKPHVWVRGQGWAGDLRFEKETQWLQWENDYLEYLKIYLKVADSLKVEMFCIGTEMRHFVTERPEFFQEIINVCRKSYSGRLTYAANWDNYNNVKFWDQLDFIGIDAYFPLSENKHPTVKELKTEWKPIQKDLQKLSDKLHKPVVFTEYGYRSVDYSTLGHWNATGEEKINHNLQKDAYQALYQTFCDRPWFAGGFLWKWFPNHAEAGGVLDSKYTPQNKPAEQLIKDWFHKKNAM